MRLTSLLLLLLLSIAPFAGAHADFGRDIRIDAPAYVQFARGDGDRRNRGDRGDRGEKADVAREAQRMNGGGRVLAVHPVDGGYRVKLLKDGDVRVVFVPGN